MTTPKQKLINRLIFFLSLAGLGISVYLLYTYTTNSPIVCINAGCESVRNSPFANPFGIPMPLFGVLGYAFLIILTVFKTLQFSLEKVLTRLLFLASGAGFLFSVYLTGIEAFIIKKYCMWCLASAAIMTIIFLLSRQLYAKNTPVK